MISYKRLNLAFIFFLLIISSPMASASARAFVANTFDNTVTVINTATSTVIATISVGRRPIDIVFNNENSFAYVSNESDGTISVINTATNTLNSTITLGGSPQDMFIEPSGRFIYVTDSYTNKIYVISTLSNALISEIPLELSPQSIFATADLLYVRTFSRIYLIRIAGNILIDSIDIPSNDFSGGFAASSDDKRIYLPIAERTSSSYKNSLQVIDVATKNLIANTPVNGIPSQIKLNSSGTQIFLTTMCCGFEENNLTILNSDDFSEVNRIPLGNTPSNVAIDPSETRAYVTNNFYGVVHEVNLVTGRLHRDILSTTNGHTSGLVVTGPSLSLSQSGPEPILQVGTNSKLSISVRNRGAFKAEDATVLVNIPKELHIISVLSPDWNCVKYQQPLVTANLMTQQTPQESGSKAYLLACTLKKGNAIFGENTSSIEVTIRPKEISANSIVEFFASTEPNGGHLPPRPGISCASETLKSACTSSGPHKIEPLKSIVPTRLTLSSNFHTSARNQEVVFIANIIDGSNPTGMILFNSDNKILCANEKVTNGKAYCKTSMLTVGKNTVHAKYSGDIFNKSSDAQINHFVQEIAVADKHFSSVPALNLASLALLGLLFLVAMNIIKHRY